MYKTWLSESKENTEDKKEVWETHNEETSCYAFGHSAKESFLALLKYEKLQNNKNRG